MSKKKLLTRQYSDNLLTSLKHNAHEETVKGVKVVVKPIPEGGNDGDMDPRVYKSMKNAALFIKLMKLMPKSKKPKTPLETIMPLRNMFNTYKGAYIADKGVITDFVKIKSADGYEVPVRVYTNENHGQNLPVLVYYHGGGFFGGGPDIVEQMCKLLVQKHNFVVFNIDYRLCPENAYPAPLDDCFYATKWAHENVCRYGGSKDKMLVGGDSAGGNLAAAVTLRDREESTGMVKASVLLYPAVNLSGKHTEFYKGVDMSKYKKSAEHNQVLTSTLSMMSSMLGNSDSTSPSSSNLLNDIYLQGKLSCEHIYASPMLADLKGLPPVLLIFGEHDFLVFEDFAYAQMLAKQDVKLKTIVYRGMGHGFADQIGVAPQAEDCIFEIAAFANEII